MQRYTEDYFANYKTKGRFLKREQGDRWHQFNYWQRYVSKHYSRGSNILEVGCGLGYFSSTISRKFEYVGTDISLLPLATARSNGRTFNFVQSNVLWLGFRSESFDVVVAFDILEHIPDPEEAILEIFRVLRKNGRLIMTVPNVKSFGNRIKVASEGLVPAMYTDRTHVSLLNVEEWIRLFVKSGFQILRVSSDTLWDIPYSTKIPLPLQKVALIPFNLFVSYFFGGLPWMLGENLVVVCKK